MRKPKVIFCIIVILAILVGLTTWHFSLKRRDNSLMQKNIHDSGSITSVNSTANHAIVKSVNTMAGFLNAFKTPIELYGKVVDQHGEPVPEATVKLSPVDTPFGDDSKSKLTINSDANGRFSVKGVRGVSMGVQVSKAGYLYLSPLGGPSSSAMIDYANGAEAGKRFSNPATPLTLTLLKIGPLEPMAYTEQKRWSMQVDGTPRKIALDSNDGIGPHQIEFRFMSDWSKLPKNNDMYGKRYDWSFEARIPGGGFIWNDSDYNFEAPETGYKEFIRYNHPASQPREKWKRFQHGRYFVKFADGSYGRIRFDIDASTESDYGPLSMTSWLNLKPGSRNLASPENDGSGFHDGNPEKE